MPPDELADALARLPAPWHGRYFASVESTQDEARTAVRTGAPSQSIFVADYQRAGRGRQGRSWQAAPGTALLLSVVFRETSTAVVPWRWTSLTSVSLVEAIEVVVPHLRPSIKWPNDVLLDGQKLAGVLAESAFDGQQLVIIVGVGVNVANAATQLLAVGAPATSLRLAAGRDVERGDLLAAFVGRMTFWLTRPWSELYGVWRARLWGQGQRLRLLDLDREEEVVVLDAEPDGALRVRLADGTERRTTTGELIL